MGRRAAPYTVFDKDRRGVAWLQTTLGGARHRESLGVAVADPRVPGDAERVAEAARQAYARLVQGRSLAPALTARVQTIHTLDELVEDWLVEDAATYPASAKLTVTHAAHVIRFANAPSAPRDTRTPLERLVDDAGPTDYVLHRLRMVLKSTVIKEVSTLFRFYEWTKKREHCASVPPRPKWPKKAIGVRAGPQRAEPVHATHKQLEAIIAALPIWAARGGRGDGKQTPKAIPVRDLAVLAYDTGLRPSTIARLEGGVHYRKGADRLWIPPEIDKGRNRARYVPLTKRAARAMAHHYKPGVIFGRHDLRVQWKRAAAKVLPPDARPEDFSIYDYRHGSGRLYTKIGGLLAAAAMLGHNNITTTNQYVQATEADALAAVRKINRGKR
jgi:integrase